MIGIVLQIYNINYIVYCLPFFPSFMNYKSEIISLFPECNDHFDNVTYFKDNTFSPKCYMTNHSSVVELTCPVGYVLAENGARTVKSECVCKDNIGYTPINATCLRKFLTFNSQPKNPPFILISQFCGTVA